MLLTLWTVKPKSLREDSRFCEVLPIFLMSLISPLAGKLVGNIFNLSYLLST